MSLVLALAVLAAALASAVARPRRLPDWLVAGVGAGMLLALGAVDGPAARDALSGIAPTVGFLAALLLIAEGCRREGLFEALGTAMARRSGGAPVRLLALVFAAAATVTAVLSLDATVVLLTPVVLVTAQRLRVRPEPHLYACAHLANAASLLLPVSNLTNLLAFRASGLSFARFGALMALPWLAAIAVEWIVLRRAFGADLIAGTEAVTPPAALPLPRYPLAVLALTLAAFTASSAVGVAEVWVAVAGAAALTLPALRRGALAPVGLVRAAEPGLLAFVLALAVIVRTASDAGLADGVDALLPGGSGLPALLAIAGVSAVLANVVNNLPATLVLLPLVAASGPAPVLAVLVGVNVGPNLTYAGSLATLLWRRVLRAAGGEVSLGRFTRLGLATTPAALALATAALWLAGRVVL